MMYKLTISKILKHFHLVNKHRFIVFKLSIRAGIPLQGLVHDLSKYSFVEFFESARYYAGTYSPIKNAKDDKGYSEAWLHHKGRNKHHFEYWYDYDLDNPAIVMPFKYYAELVCDSMSASMVYNGKKFTNDSQLKFYEKKREHIILDPRFDQLLLRTYKDISIYGVNYVIRKKYLRKLYDEYIK